MQQLLRSWDLSEDMNIQCLSPGPAGAFVLTAPDLCLFNITTGNVRRPPLNGPWSLAPEHLPGGRVSLAVATAGKPLAISRVLSFLEGNDLAAGTTGYDDYEAEVTAVAFANKHPILAFAVRERAGHRVFLVDPSSLDGTHMQCVEFYPHARPWCRVPNVEPGVPGVTSLAFSPDDTLLITHGQYETTDFRLELIPLGPLSEFMASGKRQSETASATVDCFRYASDSGKWCKAATDANWRLATPARAFMKDSRFLSREGYKVFHFVRVPPSSARATEADRSPETLIAVETEKGIIVFDEHSNVHLMVPLVNTSRYRGQHAFSDDGRWLAVGNNVGMIHLWDLATGQETSLTADDRPAHGGPIVGMAFSTSNAVSQDPDYLVTAGEENTIRMWLIFDRLKQLKATASDMLRKAALLKPSEKKEPAKAMRRKTSLPKASRGKSPSSD